MSTFRLRRFRAPEASRKGFTLPELLVTLGIIGILAGLAGPGLAQARSRTMGASCLNNLRALQMTFFLYAGDNDDLVVWNVDYVRHSWVASGRYSPWIPESTGCTNVQWLTRAEFAGFSPYLGTASTYKCPADRTTVSIAGRLHPWVRSYGANFFSRKMADLQITRSVLGEPLAPAEHYTFNEPHPGYVVGLLGVRTDSRGFVTFPAHRHHRAATFAFADGHVELHQWQDTRTRRVLTDCLPFDIGGSSLAHVSLGNPDLDWLSARCDSGTAYNRQDADIVQAVLDDPSLLFKE